MATAQELYAGDDFGVELKQTAYALDSTTIDLCLSLFPWALFRQAKGTVKLHTLLNLHGSIPSIVRITMRRIGFHDDEKKRNFNFLTNHFDLPALTIAKLYKSRWKVELFFKWIKQHLRIKRFHGASENAVKIQIWVAISIYVLSQNSAGVHNDSRNMICLERRAGLVEVAPPGAGLTLGVPLCHS